MTSPLIRRGGTTVPPRPAWFRSSTGGRVLRGLQGRGRWPPGCSQVPRREWHRGPSAASGGVRVRRDERPPHQRPGDVELVRVARRAASADASTDRGGSRDCGLVQRTADEGRLGVGVTPRPDRHPAQDEARRRADARRRRVTADPRLTTAKSTDSRTVNLAKSATAPAAGAGTRTSVTSSSGRERQTQRQVQLLHRERARPGAADAARPAARTGPPAPRSSPSPPARVSATARSDGHTAAQVPSRTRAWYRLSPRSAGHPLAPLRRQAMGPPTDRGYR